MEELKYALLEDSHVDDLAPIWSDAEVIRFTNIKSPCTLSEIQERVRLLKEHDVFAVSTREGLVGVIGCPCVDRAIPRYGLFYHFRKSSWGKGYGTAAAKWLIGFMKNKYGKVTFLADVVAGNEASEKILKRLGFRFVSEEDGFERDGIRMKIHNYTL